VLCCAEEGVALRGLFIIDKEGVIQHSTINNLAFGRNVDETVRILQVCTTTGPLPQLLVQKQQGQPQPLSLVVIYAGKRRIMMLQQRDRLGCSSWGLCTWLCLNVLLGTHVLASHAMGCKQLA
jgi:hypothetical protein